MRWLRDLERKIEARLEGIGKYELHALEAARLASGFIFDNCSRPHSGLTVAPNLIYVPFKDVSQVPANFEGEVARLLVDELKQRGYKVLSPVVVRAVGPELQLNSIVADWSDSQERIAYGFIEGVSGPARGGLWGIAKGGVVVGRGSDADVRIVDPEVSRHHLGITVVGEGRLRLEDLGSHNGTRVGKSILAEPTTVKKGSRINLGTSQIRLWTLPWVE